MKYLKLFESENDDISYYDELIDSFLDDMKDISMYKFIKSDKSNNSILYSFFIKNYDSKREEIKIFIEEIIIACKNENKNIKIYGEKYHSNLRFDKNSAYITIEFTFNTSSNNYIYRINLHELIRKLGFVSSTYFDPYLSKF